MAHRGGSERTSKAQQRANQAERFERGGMSGIEEEQVDEEDKVNDRR